MNLTCIGTLVSDAGQPRDLPFDGDEVGDDLEGVGLVGVGVRPAGDLVQVVADAGDLPGALPLDLGRRRGPGAGPRHGRSVDPRRGRDTLSPMDTHAAVRMLTAAGAEEALVVDVVDVAQNAAADHGRESATRSGLERRQETGLRSATMQDSGLM